MCGVALLKDLSGWGRKGSEEIKKHRFFDGIDWGHLRNMEGVGIKELGLELPKLVGRMEKGELP